jgi:branched-chain amino acid transport system permease protein
MAMVAAYAYWSFATGEFGPTFPKGLSFAFALVVAVLVGVLTELIAFRPLRTASPLAKLVSSLGVLLIAQAAMILAFSNTPQDSPAFLTRGTFEMLGGKVPKDNFVLTGIVVGTALALAAVYRWTRFGLATRAASENEVSGMLAGLSPNELSLVNTVAASVVAGAVGVLAGRIALLDPFTLPLQVVPALAAALFARFTSFGIACAAGLGIGVLENVVYYLSTKDWFPKNAGVPWPGLSELLVFLLIVIAMFWRGASLPQRGELVERGLPIVPRPERLARSALIGTLVCGVALIVFPYDFRQALVNSLIGAVICLSLVVITGFVGQVSVVQLALSGVAGFVISHLAQDHGVGFPAAPIIGILAATILGFLIGVSALRVRGVSLAVVTLAAAVAIEQFGFVNSIWGESISGSRVSQPSLFGLKLGTDAPFKGLDGKIPSATFGFVILAITVLLCLLVANLRRSDLGLRMLAVRSNERAAAATGINVTRVKLAAFTLGSFIAGVAGAMFAYNFGSVSAFRFGALTSLSLIAFAYIGGITMVSGAIFAGLLSTEALFPHAFDRWFGISGTWTILFGGVALISTLIFNPEGVAGSGYRKKMQKKKLRAAGLAKPSPVEALLSRSRRATQPDEP